MALLHRPTHVLHHHDPPVREVGAQRGGPFSVRARGEPQATHRSALEGRRRERRERSGQQPEQITEGPLFQGWLRKYDPTGKELWAYEHPTAIMDGETSVHTLTLNGDIVYITGSEPVGDKDTHQAFLIRLDDGEPTWSSIIEAPDTGRIAVALTSTGSPVVALGVIDGLPHPWVGAFGPDGAALWSNTYLPDIGGRAYAVPVTPDDQLLVAGLAYGAGSNDFRSPGLTRTASRHGARRSIRTTRTTTPPRSRPRPTAASTSAAWSRSAISSRTPPTMRCCGPTCTTMNPT